MIKNVVGFICVCFFYSLNCEGQKEFSNWYFGDKAGINFNTSPTSYHSGGSSSLNNIPSTISNNSGELLFYSNNKVVWNRNHQVMQNGENLEGGINGFGTVIVPKPNNPNIYFLFTLYENVSGQNIDSYIYYSEIDMSLDNGLGAVTGNKNILLSSDLLTPRLVAVQHANNEDFWIVGHGLNNSNFYSFLITENGVEQTPVISDIGSVYLGQIGLVGGMKISHDAKRLASIFFDNDKHFDGKVEIMSFNDVTGEVYGDVLNIGEFTFLHEPSDNATGAPYYLEFSPNNSFLYISCSNVYGNGETGRLYPSSLLQFNVNVNTDEELLFTQRTIHNSRDRFWGIELGQDERIYLAVYDEDAKEDQNGTIRSIGIINEPDNQGVLSNYEHLKFPLTEERFEPRNSSVGLPQDIRQFFYLNIDKQELCAGQDYLFSFNSSDEVVSVEWDFGDGEFSSEFSPLHNFEAGTYTVTLKATYDYSTIQKTTEVTIPDSPNIITSYSVCDDAVNDGFTTIYLETIKDLIFRNDTCGELDFYLNMQDAENDVNALDISFTNTSNPQTIFVRITQIDNPMNFRISPLEITVDSFPELVDTSFKFCDEDGDGSITLNTNTFDSFFKGSLNCAHIEYYLNFTDASNAVNPIIGEFDTVSNSQKIYVRLSERSSSFTSSIASFTIDIAVKPELDLNDFYSLCTDEALVINVQEGYDFYLWSNGSTEDQIEITEPGSYSISVGNNSFEGDCSETFNFIVIRSEPAVITDITINDLSNNNRIEVLVSGSGDYEYSLDGFNFQDSPVFENLMNSELTAYVRDKNGCGITEEEVLIMIFPRFFTPNGDGVNDFWQIRSSIREPDLKIEVYDRYGKLLTKFTGSMQGWDGTFQGQDLPTNDYWCKITRPSNGKVYYQHFTLKR